MNGVIESSGNQPSTYEVRRMMISLLKQSQQIEHDFFDQCRHIVRQTSTRLTDHFSELIQRQMPEWSEPQCREFAQYSGVSLDAIMRWKVDIEALVGAQAVAAQAEIDVKAAAAARSECGGLFGAKKGREDAYRFASERHSYAETALKTAKGRVGVCIKSATEAATAVLRDCVACAGVLAEAANYAESRAPREIMVDAAIRAKELTAKHEHGQSKLNTDLSVAVQFLSQRYGLAHE